MNSFTSWPSLTTCHAMSAIRPSRETKRNFFLSMELQVVANYKAIGPTTHEAKRLLSLMPNAERPVSDVDLAGRSQRRAGREGECSDDRAGRRINGDDPECARV